ncbi:MAG: hypothetical protein NZ891_05260, partial [bacterium]|nr:hypothetical protein [bacterium]MDW8164133.1 hypothetical protein [Candidatus Omnitrophota bacterium]
FYVDKVPIENFEIAMRKSLEIFGSENVSFYTISGYKLIKDLNIKGNLSFKKCLNLIGEKNFINFLKTYIVPKGKVLYTLDKWFCKFPVEKFKRANCVYEFLNPYHIHIDLYGNYMPSFCAGITIGNYEEVLEKGINDEDKVLKFLLNDIYELLLWAESYGYKRKDGYVNKCHLCLDIRKFLIENNFRFDSLKPEEFYKNL